MIYLSKLIFVSQIIGVTKVIDDKTVKENKKVDFRMGEFPETIHRWAKLRAVEKGMTLKDYIALLIITEVEQAEKLRK